MTDRQPRISLLLVVSVIALFAATGCGKDGVFGPAPQNPAHIHVRYLLVGFAGSIPGKTIARTRAEADTLADSLFAAARAGADFATLTDAWSDDDARGTVAIANYGVTAGTGEYRRGQLVSNFGNVSFSLAADSIGLAEYDSLLCPYGWFVIHRVD
jgi:hypothetical protein